MPSKKSLEFIPGKVVQCTEHLRRVLAPNPSMMTGPGTNTYLIGNGDIAILDPGPKNKEHLKALLKATEGETVRWIFCTHTHNDHSPGTVPLVEALQNERDPQIPIEIIGLPAALHNGSPLSSHDRSFEPTHPANHGDIFDLNGLTIEAVCTPGHASNHVCFYLHEEKILLTGDHIMDGSTVVIAPPDGDMKAYIESLELLNTYDIKHLAPAHGNLIDTPKEIVAATIAHRLKREDKVIVAVKTLPDSTIKELVTTVYDDTPTFLHPVAEFSLLAHILKLKAEGKAGETNERWRWL
ncbi:MAG: MBL fold metallo-hydrolase [Pseudomonadales bacterium]|nr:MBL fold metallo-hydrolase [Pseudomonadales bacterium]